MYEWRTLTERERKQILSSRRKNHRPWHGPPHFEYAGIHAFHLSAACYEHAFVLGKNPERMEQFESALIELFRSGGVELHAWSILPNHWHALVHTPCLKSTILQIGQLHGRTSYQWNQFDGTPGRKCWHRCSDRRIRSERHFYATRNYIHHNPVKHGYVEKWEQWPWSSAADYIAKVGREVVLSEWKTYPLLDMGEKWDD